MRRLAVLPAALLALAAPAEGRAQVVRGHVLDDSTRTGLPDVVVSALRDGEALARVTTDAEGWFRFALPDSATVELEGRRLGWRTVLSRPLHVPRADTVSVELWMGVRAIPVAPLVVTARSNLGRSRFRRHMEEWGRGVFFTPEMVDSIAPIHPVDVLRGQEKTWLGWSFGARKTVPSVRTFLGQGCVKFMLNGVEVRRWGEDAMGTMAWEDTSLEFLQGREIVAVEYYRYVAEVPPDIRRYAFGSGESTAMCGLVVYWTKEGW